MKKVIVFFMTLFLMNCTSVSASSGQEQSKEVTEVIEELKYVINENDSDKLDEFFWNTFKNRIIVKEIKKYDFSQFLLIFSNPTLISKDKAKSMMIINYGNDSTYINLTWRLKGSEWKIQDVSEKK